MTIDIKEELTNKQFEILEGLFKLEDQRGFEELLNDAHSHVLDAKVAHQKDSSVNAAMAEAILAALTQVNQRWSELSELSQHWFQGAVLYFISSDDEIGDLDSPIGFEDDAEVLNACLRFAGFNELTIDPDDFDDFS